ncbi:iron-containing alcohol dehydrogenase [Roseinatronobacter alkalisoli]|uniref:Iron-containing alcohol dehydrogenase n=1 Tax=Roseinatronobacter alkalisoli TaxID=3028235 RepID=A0ABT5T7D9_9RHOB|nr:iron-containing alcohol dehydrogenase [Roseinatronobacter sp. HJB301]MDD7971032.1 iron-containing alcohol dehydrogenase [Roseinatronobacter sp. HJB301]
MMRRVIEVLQPQRLQTGTGAAGFVAGLLADTGRTRPVVIADAFNATRLDALGLDPATPCHPVAPEPDTDGLAGALQAARAAQPDVIIGFGGGSAMDMAKLVAVMVGNSLGFDDVSGPGRAPSRSVMLVQVPTTAGTGSEAGTRALLTEPGTMRKIATESPHMLADLVVLDPELTLSLPPAITAATGIDALAHCVEVFTSRRAHPMIDGFALQGIRLIGQNLHNAVHNGNDSSARAAMLLASYYGGVGLGPVNTTAGHAVAYPLGTRHHLPHGLANALIFPHTLAANLSECPEKTAQICDALGFAATDEAAVRDGAIAWCESLGLDMCLRAHNVPETDLPEMAAEAHAIRRLLDFNPRDLSAGDILELYKAAY